MLTTRQAQNPRVEILQIGRMPISTEQTLDAYFQVWKAWQAKDEAAFLTCVGPSIRGLAVSGHGEITLAILEHFPRLEIISSFGVGYDHIDAAGLAGRGIVVTHTPDVLSEEVADLAVGLLISTIRNLPQADRFVRSGQWEKEAFPLARSLKGRKVGILGLGRIGRAVARRLSAFDLELAYHGRNRQVDVAIPYYSSLHAMAEAVDVLMITAPGGEDTKGIVDRSVFKALGPEGYVINVGRGSVVDETDLVDALSCGAIVGAGLDVFENEPYLPPALLALPNVVVLPHVGSASIETRDAMGRLVVENLVAWFENRTPIAPTIESSKAFGWMN